MRGQAGFWDIDERFARLSEAGDPLERLNAVVPWDVFRKPLAKALKRSDGAKGGRPPYDCAFRRSRPPIPTHRDHLFRLIATSVARMVRAPLDVFADVSVSGPRQAWGLLLRSATGGAGSVSPAWILRIDGPSRASRYRSKTNEEWLAKNGYVSDIHHKKPKGRPMSERTARANGRRSKVRAFVEHVFAQQKAHMGLFVRTIGIARARTKIGMVNLAYNFTRYAWHERRTVSA